MLTEAYNGVQVTSKNLTAVVEKDLTLSQAVGFMISAFFFPSTDKV